MENRSEIAFPKLSESEIEALSEVGRKIDAAADDVLFAEGEQDFDFYAVLDGQIDVIECREEDETLVARHGPGEFTGDVDMIERRGALVSAVARVDSHLLQVSADDLQKLIREMPDLGEKLLNAFLARRLLLEEMGLGGVRVIGSRYMGDAYRLVEFAERNHIPCEWIDLEREPEADEILRRFGVSPSETPIVICRGERVLRNPSLPDLAECLGIELKLEEGEFFDLVVVGAGPAGLSAAVYAASEGHRTLIFEAESTGGQAGSSASIENYLGFPGGISGSELARRAVLQAEKFGARVSVPEPVTNVSSESGLLVVSTAEGRSVTARKVVIATGAEYLRLDLENRERFDGNGIYYGATAVEAEACGDIEVGVIGGGNSAGQAAMFLSQHVAKVWLIHREEELDATMSRYLIDRIERCDSIERLPATEVVGLSGSDRLESVTVEQEGRRRELPVRALFTFIGARAHTDWLGDEFQKDEEGFLLTGKAAAGSRQRGAYETSVPGVFAIGDVRSGSVKRYAAAVGEGAAVNLE